MILLEHHNIKVFLQKVTLPIDLKKLFWLKKLKHLCSGLALLMILMEKKLLELFTKKRTGKLNWKAMIIHLIVGLTKNILLYKNELFSTL